MKTKRLLFIISVVSVFSCLTACQKFLEPDLPSKFTDTYIYSSVSDAAKAVNSVYALFNQDAFTSRLSNSFANNTDVEMAGVSGSKDGGRRDIWSYEASAGIGDIRTVWNNAYNAINRANECIEGIQASSLYKSGNQDMKQLLGEALTLRAYWYYQLVNYWGDVPFKTTPTKAGDEFYLPRTDRMEIMSSVINDLIEIEPHMQWSEDLQYGVERINRAFVNGFIARLALCRAGYYLKPDMTMARESDYLDYYQIAADHSKKLMTERPKPLAPDFGKMFRDACQYISNDEVLYEVAFSPGYGDVAWCVGIAVTAGSHNYGSTTIFLNFPLTYYHSFDTLDTRLEATISRISYNANLEEVPANFNALTTAKWSRTYMGDKARGSSSAKGTGINWPLMRYSDVLLMFAEAENELNGGPTAEAKEALATVRKRAFPQEVWGEKVDAYVSGKGTKEEFFNAIVDERAWEFGGEFLRKFDLIRWNLLSEKITETRNGLNEIADRAIDFGSSYPDYLYYKRNSDNTITWYNKYSRVEATPPIVDQPNKGDNPDGYLRHGWATSLARNRTDNEANLGGYIGWQFRGYQDNTGNTPVRYILPIHSDVIIASQGILKNDGYGGFGN